MLLILFMCIISEGLIVVLCGKEKRGSFVCVGVRLRRHSGRDLSEKCTGGRLRPAATASMPSARGRLVFIPAGADSHLEMVTG